MPRQPPRPKINILCFHGKGERETPGCNSSSEGQVPKLSAYIARKATSWELHKPATKYTDPSKAGIEQSKSKACKTVLVVSFAASRPEVETANGGVGTRAGGGSMNRLRSHAQDRFS